MNSRKCPRCGLVNFADEAACKRCGGPIADVESHPAVENVERGRGGLWFLKRALVVLGVTVGLLLLFYASLLKSSDPLDFEQQQMVHRGIKLLEEKGFERESFMLENFTSFRSTDNWWNGWVGHREAYAATNFPFEVVTLYPEFFAVASDDTERAAILLHESYHLFGAGEASALEQTWRNRRRLGWTSDVYAQTKVWRNTKELTLREVPQLFRCGLENNTDCTEF